jgi:uncharacterized repeat protein (TIGR01451 family)
MTSLVPFSPKTTLVFVDSAVDKYEGLINGVIDGAEAIALHPNRDGVTQIAEVLANRRNIEQIHIISHGAPGCLFIGSDVLSNETLSRYTDALTQWLQALAEHAEIFLYGCQVAAGAYGQAFISRLNQLLKVNVAASTTLIGNAALGGNWNLDSIIGSVQSPLALKPNVRQAYPAVFAPISPNVLYGVNNTPTTPGAATEIVTIDTTTGAATIVGNLEFDSFAIARDTNTGNVYYIEVGSGNPRVAFWNPTTGENTVVGNTGTTGVQFLKLAQSQDGTLFALGSSPELYTIDPNTGIATERGTISGNGFTTGSGDAAFDPNNPNRLIVSVTGSGLYELFAVDVSNPDAPGTPEFLGSLTDIDGNFGAGSLAIAQDGQLYASSDTELFVVNFTPGGLVDATNPTDLVGSMSTNISDFGTLPNNPPEIDVSITKTDNLTTIGAGQTITYTVTVSNPSSIDAPSLQVLDEVPATITSVNWSAVITGGGSFINAAQGTGNSIDSRLNLTAGASVTYTITGTVSAATADNTLLENTVTVQQIPGTPANQIFTDANLANNTATDTTTVLNDPLNQPPIANNDSVTTNVGIPVNVLVLNNDSDPNGDPLEILTNFTQPTNGSVTLNNNGTPGNTTDDFFTYTPDAGFGGDDSFVYTITDGRGGQDSATVSISVGSGLGEIEARNDRARTTPSQPVNIFVLNNDVPGQRVDLVGIGQSPSNGTVRVNSNGTPNILTDDFVVYTPNAGFIGIDTFTYTIEGGADASGSPVRDTATVTVEVSGTPGCLPGERIVGGAGRDVLVGTINSDPMFGRGGNDVLRGVECDDVLRGGRGNDVLRGGSDQDTLYGNQGSDTLSGGSGDDVLSGGLGRDTMSGDLGDDRLRGGRGNDRLDGDRGNDTLFGNLGDDVIFGGVGRDRLDGGAGNDNLDGGANPDIIQSGTGDDRAQGGNGDDTINGGLGNDFLQGNQGNDRIFGRNGNDTIQGGGGEDVIDGGLGDDRIRGGAGDDAIQAGAGNDAIDGGLGNDFINAGLGDDTATGGRGNDTILGRRGNDTISGNGGRDTLDGGLGDDTIDGGANNDVIQGRQGNDILRGSLGDDFINAGLGNDRAVGGRGNDTIFGRKGNDTIFGNGGQDTLDGGLGNDTINGGANNDIVRGSQGDDVLRGGGGDDLVVGGLGNDFIGGNNGNDTLFGRRGNDRINGGNGDDVIVGGLGRDRLTGGPGRDRFVYQTARDGQDIITDFEVGADLIDLNSIFDDPRYTARNPFRRFIDIAQVGANTVVRIDPNGNDPERDFVTIATLQNVAANTLRVQSFVL